MSPFDLLVCIALIFISACLSASEVALFSLSRFQLRSLKEKFRSVHRKIKRLLTDPGGLLITILMINEIVNISISALITSAISQSRSSFSTHWFAPWVVNMLLGLLVTAPIVLFLCEVTPKVVAARMNLLISTLAAGPMTLIYDLFRPLRQALSKVVAKIAQWTTQNPFEKKRAETESKADSILKESDFMLMVEEGHKEGAIQQNELELIRNVFELDDTTVANVYTPLSQVQTLTVNTTLKDALLAMRSQRYSRIPVTSPNRKEVVGVLYSKDLLRAKIESNLLTMTVAEIMRKPFFVNSSLRLSALFRRFKQQRIHMAIVHGDKAGISGEALGVVTMSDLLEALFEDIFPEEDLFDGVEEALE